MPFLDFTRLLPGALVVYLVHAWTFFHFEPWVKVSVTKFGFVAISWFFVLSGFVLVQRYKGEVWNAAALFGYLRARTLRIVPAYAVGLAMAVVLVSVGVSLFGFPAYFEDVAARTRIYNFALPLELDYACIALNTAGHFAFLQTYYAGCGGFFLLNPPLWSASVEVAVYVIFPFSLAAIKRIPAQWVLPAALTAYLLIVGFSLLKVPAALASDWPTVSGLHVHLVVRWLEFTIGCLLGLAWNAQTRSFAFLRQSHWWILAAAILICCFAFYLDRRYGNQLRLQISLVSITGAIGFFLALLWLNTALKASRGRASTYVAFLSYTLYCVHWPYLELLGATGGAAMLSRSFGHALAPLVSFLILLPLAAAIRYAVEPVVARVLEAMLGSARARWFETDGNAARRQP